VVPDDGVASHQNALDQKSFNFNLQASMFAASVTKISII
jgi:hypothetical protein